MPTKSLLFVQGKSEVHVTAALRETHKPKVWSTAIGDALSPLLSTRNSIQLLINNTFADLFVAVTKDNADFDPKRIELRTVVGSSGPKSRNGGTTESECTTCCGADTCTMARRTRLRRGSILPFRNPTRGGRQSATGLPGQVGHPSPAWMYSHRPFERTARRGSRSP
jgi:hypothetical protein